MVCSFLAFQCPYKIASILTNCCQCVSPIYKNLTFRGQKTVWGSCSSKKNINLNYKLLFLPARLVRYVLVHELCHIVHLDHSRRFWALVEQYEPDYARLKKELRHADHYMPEWIIK